MEVDDDIDSIYTGKLFGTYIARANCSVPISLNLSHCCICVCGGGVRARLRMCALVCVFVPVHVLARVYVFR